ncbi:MAG: hypothetical protein IJM10_02055, partial [Clostridia bacterium]|nr:hypothetical protein [Clostridia bacterium]
SILKKKKKKRNIFPDKIFTKTKNFSKPKIFLDKPFCLIYNNLHIKEERVAFSPRGFSLPTVNISFQRVRERLFGWIIAGAELLPFLIYSGGALTSQ